MNYVSEELIGEELESLISQFCSGDRRGFNQDLNRWTRRANENDPVAREILARWQKFFVEYKARDAALDHAREEAARKAAEEAAALADRARQIAALRAADPVLMMISSLIEFLSSVAPNRGGDTARLRAQLDSIVEARMTQTP